MPPHMHVLIVEDEASVAQRVERLLRQVVDQPDLKVARQTTLAGGLHHVKTYPIDLLLLDLNLNGEDGFGILRTLVSYAFHTIIISANTHQAIEAFEYGVLDFIPKPFTVERLQKAMDRYDIATQAENPAQYLTVRRKGVVEIVEIDQLDYIKGAGNYSELYMTSGDKYLHDKPLQRLETLLPSTFHRIHRSYICNWSKVSRVHKHGAGKYEVELQSGALLPLSRNQYRVLLGGE